MSKKPQKPQQNPKKNQIVDQQNEPFLRTIFKRVRNINKKITEITDLQKRGQQLKPEQIQKINRKAEYEQQRSRLENIADFFRQVYAENAEHYRNNQLQQLDSLAQAVAVLRSGANFKEADKLTELNRALTQPSNLSVADNTKYVSEVLRRFATDHKLKKSLSAFVGQTQPAQQQQQKPEPVVQKEEPVQEVKVQQKQPVQCVRVPEPVLQQTTVVQPPVQQQTPVQEQKVEEQPQTTTTQETPAEQKQQGQQSAQNGDRPPRQYNKNRGDNRGEYRNRGPRQPRGQGQEGGYRKQGGQRRRYDNQERKQRPNYRPKTNQNEQAQNESDSDSSLQEPQIRDFRRQEVRQLVEQGFTVVGKPKPKAKQGQKQWHQHTHGRKDHYGHQKRNN